MPKARRGIMRRLVFTYITIFSVIVICIEIMAYFIISNISERTAQANREQLCQQLAVQAADYLDEMARMAEQVSTDSRIVSVFNSLKNETRADNYFERDILARLDMGSILASYNGPSMRVWRVSIYDAHGDFISSGAPIEPMRQATENLASDDTKALFGQIAAVPKSPLLLPPQNDRWSDVYTGQYVSLVYPLSNYYGSELYGAVEVQQPLESLTKRLSLDGSVGMEVLLMDGEGRQIWPAGGAPGGSRDTRYTTILKIPPQYGWELVLTQSRGSVLRPFIPVFWILLIGGALLVLTMMPVVYLISRRISAPLVKFSRQVSTASLGNLPDNWAVEENIGEIRELGMAFSAMMERLDTAIVFEKKAYLQALQAQMNPHFLYNTLSMLSAMGIEAGSDKIAYACERLSDLMRYTADASSSTMDKEIESVRDYLEIMKLRYEDCFSYEVVTEGDLGAVKLPRLILEPLAENCFEHAFKDIPPPWRVEVYAKSSPGGWEVRVADDGSGFDGARLAELEKNVALYSGDLHKNYENLRPGGLGLLNTIVRLKLLGGISYAIEERAPKGSVITLKCRTVSGITNDIVPRNI